LHCGACGNACSGEQVCGLTGCRAALVGSICEVPRATFLLDEQTVDDAMAAAVATRVAAVCQQMTTRVVEQAASGVLHPESGRPVGGTGDVVVVLGGTAFQRIVRYAEQAGLTRVYNRFDDPSLSAFFYVRGNATPVVQTLQADLTETHSFFLMESVVDPVSHTWVLELYGLNAAGTRAAAWFFMNRVLENPTEFTERYYVYEWTAGAGDAGADSGPTEPSGSDTFTLKASGP
jgi:hypothetical protein